MLLIEPKVFADARGHFFESFNERAFAKATGIAWPLAGEPPIAAKDSAG